MIKASDLREGNWYLENGKEYQFDLYDGDDFKASGRFPDGIPLTEEWKIRLGFEKGEIEHPVHGKLTAWYIDTNGTDCEYFCLADGKLWSNGFLSQDMEYVHQAQNLFHAITGEELTIKEK